MGNQLDQQDAAWLDYVRKLRSATSPPEFAQQWADFQRIYFGRSDQDCPPRVWQPDPEQISRSNLGRWIKELGLPDYEALHRWSVADRAGFWEAVLDRLGIVLARPPRTFLDLGAGVEDPDWLPGAKLSCVRSCFLAPRDRPAVLWAAESDATIRSISYGELQHLVNRFASGLVEHGFHEGDGIALYMPMNLHCIVAYLGTVQAGCYVISIADSFPPVELGHRLRMGGASGIVTTQSFVRARKTHALYEKVLQADAPRAIVIPDPGAPLTNLRPTDLLWEDLLGSDATLPPVIGEPERLTNVLFSSGTTATPKAIPWTQLTPIKCAMDGCFHQDIHPSDVVAWPTNIGWMMGPWLVYASLINRATMALYEGAPSAEGFTRFVQDAGVTVLGVVPSLVKAWRTSGAADGVDWSRVRVFSSTGEPSSQQDYLWLMSRTGYRAPVIEYCGGTEIGGGHITGTVVQPASPATFTTAALGIDFVLLDEAGRTVLPGDTGELFLIPPSIGLSQHLLNRDHHQEYYAGCPVGPDGQVLRRHGDQVKRLTGGWYRAQGRADDAMNLGGIKVGSAEIERVLDGHPAVYESAAVATQTESDGADRLVVFVVLARPIDRQQLIAELGRLLAQKLNPLFRIHDMVLVDRLPRTASNKLMRRELRGRI